MANLPAERSMTDNSERSQTPLASNKVSQQIERLRARRDVEDHSVNNGWRTANAPRAEVAAADTIERLRAALEGLHFHHKVFEPDCRHCQAACPDFPDFAPETKERQYKGTRDSFYCPDCQCPKCGNTRPQPGTAMVIPLIGAAAQPSPGTWGVFCAVHGYREWHTKCPQCELSEKAGEKPDA